MLTVLNLGQIIGNDHAGMILTRLSQTDIEIAQSVELKPITEVVEKSWNRL